VWEEAAEYPCQHNAAVARSMEEGPLSEALSPFLVVFGFFRTAAAHGPC